MKKDFFEIEPSPETTNNLLMSTIVPNGLEITNPTKDGEGSNKEP